jgi:hypothetical protein
MYTHIHEDLSCEQWARRAGDKGASCRSYMPSYGLTSVELIGRAICMQRYVWVYRYMMYTYIHLHTYTYRAGRKENLIEEEDQDIIDSVVRCMRATESGATQIQGNAIFCPCLNLLHSYWK